MECDILIIVLFELHLLPINRASFKFLYSLPCDYIGLESYLEVCFVDFLARWLFAVQTPISHPAFMDVNEWWEANVSDYIDEVLARGHQYKSFMASRLSIAIGVEDFRVLIQKCTPTTWDQLCLSQIFDCMALHAPLDEFESTPPAAQFCLPAGFFIPLLRTFCYFSGVVQDCFDRPGALTRSHRFCTMVRMEIALRVTEGLVAEFATREWVLLLDEPLMEVPAAFEQSLTK